MSDLIDRQTAIDALHMHLMYRMGTDSNKKRLDEWINNLPSAQPVQRWIPCSERLPEEGSYLVWMPFAPPEGRIAVADYCDGYWNIKTPISAWMPLPAPYRGGEKE